jgi:biotin transport system substrate-specific component
MGAADNTGSGRASSNTFYIVMVAMFAAAIAVASWISVPLPFTPVPINLATLAVTITGALLGKKYGLMSVVTYILLGAVGLPVFAGFSGGLGHITGPTGGYIVGYAASAFLCALFLDILCKEKLTWWGIAVSAAIGTAACYVLGTIWFMALTNTGLIPSLTMCVLPFIPGDVIKTILAVPVVMSLRSKLPQERI